MLVVLSPTLLVYIEAGKLYDTLCANDGSFIAERDSFKSQAACASFMHSYLYMAWALAIGILVTV